MRKRTQQGQQISTTVWLARLGSFLNFGFLVLDQISGDTMDYLLAALNRP